MQKAARGVQSIEIGFRIIRVLKEAGQPLPLKEIGHRAAMPPSKAHVYLASFAHEGLVRQDAATGHYGLGPLAFQLGLAAVRQVDIVSEAREELDYLRAVTRCAVYVCIWSNRGPVIIAKVDGEGQGSLVVRIGFVISLSTATGLVFLAHLSDEDREAAIAGDDVLRGMPDLSSLIAAVKRDGYAVAPEPTLLSGFSGVAAPLADYSGQIVAALTVFGPARLIAQTKADPVHLIDAARRLSAKLGAAPP